MGVQNEFDRITQETADCISYVCSGLNNIPISLSLNKSIRKLDISYNNITKLENLPPNLTHLVARCNRIKRIEYLPDTLEYLILTNNQIERIENLPKNLKYLVLTLNKIKRLENLPNALNALFVSINKIKKMENLPASLKHLDLWKNNIRRIENLPNGLKTLILSSNRITKIECLPNELNYLALSFNTIKKLENLPENLTFFSISNNNISRLENLPQSLDSLVIRDNYITRIENLPMQLSFLAIHNNKIKKLESIQPHLNTIDVRANKIKDIDNELIRAIIFHELDLVLTPEQISTRSKIIIGKNPINQNLQRHVKGGPNDVITYLKALEEEPFTKFNNVERNEIKIVIVGNSSVGKSSLVNWFVNSKKEICTTHGLEITELELDIFRGFEDYISTIIRFYDFGGQEYYHDAHHLFFTDSAIYLLIWEVDTNIHGVKSTKLKSSNYKEIEIDLNHYPLEYWLEAIKHYSIDKSYSSQIQELESNLIFKKGTFENTSFEPSKDSDIIKNPVYKDYSNEYEKLFDLLMPRNKTKETQVLIIQNKIDKDGIVHLNGEYLNRFNNCIYDILSISIENNKRLNSFKEILLNEVFRNIGIFNGETPGYWEEIKRWILEVPVDVSIDIEEFKKICYQIKNTNIENKLQRRIIDEDEYILILKELRGLGIILHYPEVFQLRNTIFLKPKKLLEIIYKVLNNKLLEIGGVLTDNHIQSCLKDCNINSQLVTDLLLNFHLIFRTPNNGEYIAAQYLPDKPNHGLDLFLQRFEKISHKYIFRGFIHSGILLKFFSIFGEFAKKEQAKKGKLKYYIWKYGIVIERQGHMVLVKFNNLNSNENEKRSITIQSEVDKNNIDLVNEIAEILDNINKGWQTLKLLSNDGEKFVPFDVIHQAHKKRLSNITYNNEFIDILSFKNYMNKHGSLPMKKVFISYSKHDETLKDEFIKHLKPLSINKYIKEWHDEMVDAGEIWDEVIKTNLDNSDIVIFLVSHNLLATEYVMKFELEKALVGVKEGRQKLVPVILDHCDWEETAFGNFKAANNKGEVINNYVNVNEGFREVIGSLKRIIKN